MYVLSIRDLLASLVLFKLANSDVVEIEEAHESMLHGHKSSFGCFRSERERELSTVCVVVLQPLLR